MPDPQDAKSHGPGNVLENEMNCTRIVETNHDPGGSCTAIYREPSSPTPPRVPTVELRGIIPQGRLLIVAITDGRFNWPVECKPSDVQSFAKFQAVACQQFGIWINHASQDEPRAVWRKNEWDEAVSAAFARGRAAG